MKKPRYWDGLVQIAAALRLTEREANKLLTAAGHPVIATLAQMAGEQDHALLLPWLATVEQCAAAPFQAITDLPYFVGRAIPLQTLHATLSASQPAAIVSIQGMAGVGKTALAAHAAYQLRSQFPDGVLWANVAHANPLAILSAFAGAYGQDVSRYPDVESRSQAVRALLADKQALLVLDDVHHSEVVYPLLPPTGRCAVIITTQRHDLAITQGVQRLHLYGFDQATNEAQQLFSRILGEEYVAQNAVACAAIADRVGHLPLAVALAAGLLASDPQWRPAALFADLAQDQSCLSVLAQDDQNLWVPFDLSYQALTATQRIFFCALSVFGGADFGVAAAAAAAQSSTATTHDQLRQLYSCSLVQQGRAGRYRLHPLLQMFAQEHLSQHL